MPAEIGRASEVWFKAWGRSDMKVWKWFHDPKILLWIIGGLVFLIWIMLQKP